MKNKEKEEENVTWLAHFSLSAVDTIWCSKPQLESQVSVFKQMGFICNELL